MINLRYHIVSITAVFLALGIGVALGGTFLDRATVDLLEGNIGRAETRIRDTEARNTALSTQLDRADQRDDSLIEVGGEELFAGQLEDLPVLVLAQPDVDSALLRTVVENLDRTGADLRGVLEFTAAMSFGDTVDPEIANAVSVDPDDVEGVRDAVYSALRQALIEAGGPPEPDGASDEPDTDSSDENVDPDTAPDDQTTPGDDGGKPGAASDDESEGDVPSDPPADGPEPGSDGQDADAEAAPERVEDEAEQPSILTALIERDHLRLLPAGDAEDPLLLEVPGYRYVIVGSSKPRVEDNDMILELLPPNDGNTIPAVIVVDTPVEPHDDAASTIVALVREDAERTRLYTTVDNIGDFAGMTAMVLTVRDADVLDHGHFGQAAGATAVLPNPGGS